MDMSARQLGMFGPATILRVYDTYQFNDYSRYDAAQIDAAHKAAVHKSQFPRDLENAYQLVKHLVEQATAQAGITIDEYMHFFHPGREN